MKLASIIECYREPFLKKYGNHLLPSHLRALDAITACKKYCGQFTCECGNCHHRQSHPLSCGHRHCPQCQNSEATTWLTRQHHKLLPVNYFMVTLTLPDQLRALVFQHQHRLYSLLFEAAIDSLKTLALDTRHMGGSQGSESLEQRRSSCRGSQGQLGMTAVLHTHTRKLDYHPHLHIIVPAGALIEKGKAFKRRDNHYFIRGDVIAKIFRGKFLYQLYEEGFNLPNNIPKEWIVNVKSIGKGLPALQYLSRYLYRGVISEKAILKNNGTHITFRYKDSQTKTTQTRTLKGEDFIWKILMHVLPRRFRRVRDYGFLHPNAKRKLTLIQYLLGVKIPATPAITKPPIQCQRCACSCRIIHIAATGIPINFRFMKKEVPPPKNE